MKFQFVDKIINSDHSNGIADDSEWKQKQKETGQFVDFSTWSTRTIKWVDMVRAMTPMNTTNQVKKLTIAFYVYSFICSPAIYNVLTMYQEVITRQLQWDVEIKTKLSSELERERDKAKQKSVIKYRLK